jgi:hypothetical protein
VCMKTAIVRFYREYRSNSNSAMTTTAAWSISGASSLAPTEGTKPHPRLRPAASFSYVREGRIRVHAGKARHLYGRLGVVSHAVQHVSNHERLYSSSKCNERVQYG